jgi:hypothetical protein
VLLRVSSELSGESANLDAITDASAAAASRVPHAEALLAFAEAVVNGSDEEVERTRDRVILETGPEATVDAACVIGNFQRMVRIADGAGISLDPPLNMISAGLQEELGLVSYGSAANTERPGRVGRLMGRALAPMLGPIMRLMGRSYRR